MFNCVLVKVSPEVSLKTKFVRKYFFDKLVSNIKGVFRANDISGSLIKKGNGRLFIFPDDSLNVEKISSLVLHVFGVQSVSLCYSFEFQNKDNLFDSSFLFAKSVLKKGSFKVEARRHSFEEFSSKQLEELLGSKILSGIPDLKVNLSKPSQTVFLEVNKNTAYLYDKLVSGPGGLPLGCEGNVAMVFDGKKEELVCGFLLMKRGCNVFPVAKKWNLKLKGHVNKLVKWNSFRSFHFSTFDELESLKEKSDIAVKAIAFGSFGKKVEGEKNKAGLAVFWPVAFLPKTFVKSILRDFF